MFIYFSLKSQNIILYYLCFCLQLRRDCRVKLWNILSVIFHPSLRKSSCKWVKSRRKCYQNHGKHIVKYNDECWVLGGSDLGVYGRTNFIDSVILWPLLCKLEPGLHCTLQVWGGLYSLILIKQLIKILTTPKHHLNTPYHSPYQHLSTTLSTPYCPPYHQIGFPVRVSKLLLLFT